MGFAGSCLSIDDSVYYTNKINEIKGVAYNSTNNPITEDM